MNNEGRKGSHGGHGGHGVAGTTGSEFVDTAATRFMPRTPNAEPRTAWTANLRAHRGLRAMILCAALRIPDLRGQPFIYDFRAAKGHGGPRGVEGVLQMFVDVTPLRKNGLDTLILAAAGALHVHARSQVRADRMQIPAAKH